jgi:hypothetical protein
MFFPLDDFIILEGEVGTCKTYLSSKIGFKQFKKGRTVRANYDLTFPYSKGCGKVIRWDNPLELRRAHDCVIIIDEGQLVADNRNYADLPKAFYDMLPQYRHKRLTIIINTQNLDGVDVKIRRLANSVIYCNTIRFLRIPWDIKKPAFFQISTTNVFPFIHLISKLWTRKLYDSFANTGLEPATIKTVISNKRAKATITGNTI